MAGDVWLTLALLLHEGGWDEVLMVAVGLGIAYLVIVWTGRKSQDDEDGEEEEAEDRLEDDQISDVGSSDAGPPGAQSDETRRQRS